MPKGIVLSFCHSAHSSVTQIGTHQLCAQRGVPRPQAVVSLAQLLRSCHLLPLLTRAQAVKCIEFSESGITLGSEGVSSALLLDTNVGLSPNSALLHKQERNSRQWQIPCCPILWLSPFALHQLTQRPHPLRPRSRSHTSSPVSALQSG